MLHLAAFFLMWTILPIDLRRHISNLETERERRRVRAASALVILFTTGPIIGVAWLRWG